MFYFSLIINVEAIQKYIISSTYFVYWAMYGVFDASDSVCVFARVSIKNTKTLHAAYVLACASSRSSNLLRESRHCFVQMAANRLTAQMLTFIQSNSSFQKYNNNLRSSARQSSPFTPYFLAISESSMMQIRSETR